MDKVSHFSLLTLVFATATFSTALFAVDISQYGKWSTESGSNSFTVKIDRWQFDYNRATKKGEDPDEDMWKTRRARFAFTAEIGQWDLKWQSNAGDIGNSFKDFYARYTTKDKKWQFTAGHQKMPFGLERLTSSKHMSMLERSAITEQYQIGKKTGVQMLYFVNDFSYRLGIFEDTDANQSFTHSAVTRVTWAPFDTSESTLHLGLSVADRAELYSGIEVAYIIPRFHIQAEVLSDGGESGLYVQAGWVITGEKRSYTKGDIKQIKPKGTKGAWELVARVESGYGNYADIELGTTDGEAVGIGLNYYLSKNLRFGANYTEGTDEDNQKGSEFRLRAQITF